MSFNLAARKTIVIPAPREWGCAATKWLLSGKEKQTSGKK
jgi:hypothetical protein